MVLTAAAPTAGSNMSKFKRVRFWFCFLLLSAWMNTGAPAEERLSDRFSRKLEDFGSGNREAGKLLSGPVPVKMLRGGAAGRMWRAELGGVPFKVTIEDGVTRTPEEVLAVLGKIPASYRRALEIVSEEGKDGVAIYANLDGAAAHGSQDYLNMVPSANAFVVVHEAGHILEQRATKADPDVLKRWAKALAADAVSVSRYGDQVAHEDLAEFARVYALCLDGGKDRLDALRKASPRRTIQWEAILRGDRK
jgi:hypothetical protein